MARPLPLRTFAKARRRREVALAQGQQVAGDVGVVLEAGEGENGDADLRGEEGGEFPVAGVRGGENDAGRGVQGAPAADGFEGLGGVFDGDVAAFGGAVGPDEVDGVEGDVEEGLPGDGADAAGGEGVAEDLPDAAEGFAAAGEGEGVGEAGEGPGEDVGDGTGENREGGEEGAEGEVFEAVGEAGFHGLK